VEYNLAEAMKRVAIYAHYDAEGRVRRYVQHFLAGLREVTEEIWFVSTSALSDAELDKARRLCTRAWLRPNEGFDFGMWQDALAKLPLDDVDELVLTNSSVFGPLGSFEPLFRRMADSPADMWGATENFDEAPHLQSYFLVLRQRLLRSKAFEQFWASILPYKTKRQVIHSYEIGMSRFLRDYGFVLQPAVNVGQLFGVPNGSVWYEPICKVSGNPTVRYGAEFIELGLPLVKVELLRDNPFGVRLDRVYQAIERTGYDLSMIEFDRPPAPRP
jgi:lipopolysaccharide biosynthesis protein